MKIKCSFCGKKAKRYCPALEQSICSLCCGMNRGKEIVCIEDCEYLPDEEVVAFKEINKLVSENFNREEDDIWQKNEDSQKIAYYIEKFFFDCDQSGFAINDDVIYKALQKLYAFLDGKIETFDDETGFETSFIIHFEKINKEHFKKISKDMKLLTILRILKSIKTTSGGIFQNRGYLRMLKIQFIDGFASIFDEEDKIIEQFNPFKFTCDHCGRIHVFTEQEIERVKQKVPDSDEDYFILCTVCKKGHMQPPILTKYFP